MVENLPSNAGEVGLIPDKGTRIPHAVGQLGLQAAIVERVLSGAHMPHPKPQHTGPHRPRRRPNAAREINKYSTETTLLNMAHKDLQTQVRLHL